MIESSKTLKNKIDEFYSRFTSKEKIHISSIIKSTVFFKKIFFLG